MPKTINRITNSDFTEGKKKPRGWKWREHRAGVEWQLETRAGNGHCEGVQLQSKRATAAADWTQTFAITKEQHYRVEAVVTCDCPGPDGGLVLSLTPLDASGDALPTWVTTPVRSADRYVIRTFFKTPEGGRRATLSIGLRGAGFAVVHDVRVLPVLEPDARSHPWAVPQPPFAIPAPLTARSICILSQKLDRPLARLLRTRFGEKAVSVGDKLRKKDIDTADALFILDGSVPKPLRTINALVKYAEERVVVVSLPMIESISGERFVTRKITQADDPLHARVAFADFPTAGFALRDIFPYAEQPDTSAKLVQRQFRVNKVFSETCKKHGLSVLLDSETDADATSEKPIALYRRTRKGALLVMDVEPAEVAPGSLGEPQLAARIIFNALGAPQPLVGQYTSPARNDDEMLSHLRDLVERYEALSFADRVAARDPHAPQLIMLGKPVETVGLPLQPRPVIIIRSGLTGSDMAAVYGVMLWFKQLLRPAPFVSPYVNTLDRAFRIAWMPMATGLNGWGGWRSADAPKRFPIDIDFDPGSVAACIDVTQHAGRTARLVTSRDDGFAKRLADALPMLTRQLLAQRHVTHIAPPGEDVAARRSADWRIDEPKVDVVTQRASFAEEWQRRAAEAGGQLLRIELPYAGSDPSTPTIALMDQAVTLLELTMGLMLGAVVVNRESKPLDLELPRSVTELISRAELRAFTDPSEAIPVPPLRKDRLRLPPAHALIAVR